MLSHLAAIILFRVTLPLLAAIDAEPRLHLYLSYSTAILHREGGGDDRRSRGGGLWGSRVRSNSDRAWGKRRWVRGCESMKRGCVSIREVARV